MLTAPPTVDPLDVDGWPIRTGMRINVRGVPGVPGGTETTRRIGIVVEVKWTARGWVIRFQDEESGSTFHYAPPERIRVRTQTKEEREEMLLRVRRQRVKAEEDAERDRKAAARVRA